LPARRPIADDHKVRLAFVAWVAANPGAAGERAVDGAMRFANATYPCPTRAGGKR